MITRKLFAGFVALGLTVFTLPMVVHAQEPGDVANDAFSMSVVAGGLSPSADFSDGTEFGSAFSWSGTMTGWTTYVGFRGSLMSGSSDVTAPSGSALDGESATAWHYSFDLLYRYPLEAGSGWWFPYAVTGIGGRTYSFDQAESQSDADYNFGAGFEYRFGENGRWGINTEVRDFISSYDASGLDSTVHDWVYTAGVTLNY